MAAVAGRAEPDKSDANEALEQEKHPVVCAQLGHAVGNQDSEAKECIHQHFAVKDHQKKSCKGAERTVAVTKSEEPVEHH